MIVVDTNVIAYLLLPGRRTPDAEAAFLRDPDWAAPLLWRSELRNVLAQYMQSGSLSLEQAVAIMESAEDLMRPGEFAVPSADVLRITSRKSCSAYDAEFVALAQDLDVPLVTSDRSLAHKFPSLAVPLDRFAQ